MRPRDLRRTGALRLYSCRVAWGLGVATSCVDDDKSFECRDRAQGYAVVGEAIGGTRADQVKYANGAFSVARPRTSLLIEALAERDGVDV